MPNTIAEQGAMIDGIANPDITVSRLGGAGHLKNAIAKAIADGTANSSASRLGAQGRIYAIAGGGDISFGLPGGSTWSPSALFASSEVGVWYDPSDLSTMFQNSDGTTAVAVGDPVGYIADKSGNNNHAIQATAASRPILRESAGKYYLELDGVDDSLSCLLASETNPIPPALVAAAGKTLSDTTLAGLFGDSRDTSHYTSISKTATTKQWGFVDRNVTNIYSNEVTTNIGDVCVLVGYTNRANSNLILNSVDANAADIITGDVDWAIQRTVWIGNFRSSSTPIAGHFYGGVLRYATSSTEEINLVKSYLAGKSGVTL